MKQSKVMEAQPSSSTVTPPPSSSTGNGYVGASQPPEVPKQPFSRRYKFLVPLVLTVNLAVGGSFLLVLFEIIRFDFFFVFYIFLVK